SVAKILLIEDDATLGGILKASLESFQHHVDHIQNGNDGLHWLEHEQYALAVVDWGLPGLSGVDICRTFRQRQGLTPILMLTANSKTSEVVDGLESGAD